MPDRFLDDGTSRMVSSAEGDLRFQFEVIKQLAESVREQALVMRGVQEDMRTLHAGQAKQNERLAAIEANRINENVAKLEERLDRACGAIDRLESDRDVREGGSKVWRNFLGWWGPIATVSGIVFMVIYTLARAVGIVSIPSDAPRQRPAVVRHVEEAPRAAEAEQGS
jgi:hypothetical protein